MTFKDHFSGHAKLYAKYRPTYPQAMFDWLANQCANREVAWDCATGNGQVAVALSRWFTRVYATDASETQIQNARPHDRVDYEVATASDSGLVPGSVDLVTVGQALHWFDFDAFYTEVDRVLKPGGTLAVWSYGLARCGDEIDAIVRPFYEREVGPYWPDERRWIDEGYASIPFPYAKLESPKFEMISKRDLEGLLGYLRTWSASKRYEADRGVDPVTKVEPALRKAWPDPEVVLDCVAPIYMLLGKKPG